MRKAAPARSHRDRGSSQAPFRLLLLGGLYFAQGVPWGFVTVALAMRLVSLGLGPSVIGGLVAMATLPWTFKPLLGPLVDRADFGRFGRRRPIIVLSQIAMATTLLALAPIDPTRALPLFAILVIVHNVFGAAQDVASDALAIEILDEHERGRASGFMFASKYGGTLVGGPSLAWVAERAGWGVGHVLGAALLLLPTMLVLRMPAEAARPAGGPGVARVLREALRSFGRRIAVVAGLFALVAGAGDTLLYPLVFPLYRQRLGFSQDQVTLLMTLSAAFPVAGNLIGGALSDRLGRRRAIVLAAILSSAAHLGFSASAPLWPSLTFVACYAAIAGMATGMLYAGMLALFMDVTNPRAAATHFQVYMALVNVRGTWTAYAGGRAAEALPAPAVYLIGAVMQIAPLLLLFALDPRAAAREREREPPHNEREQEDVA
jgi:PAT family beta-lactamase induction signal transducer AmpG